MKKKLFIIALTFFIYNATTLGADKTAGWKKKLLDGENPGFVCKGDSKCVAIYNKLLATDAPGIFRVRRPVSPRTVPGLLMTGAQVGSIPIIIGPEKAEFVGGGASYQK